MTGTVRAAAAALAVERAIERSCNVLLLVSGLLLLVLLTVVVVMRYFFESGMSSAPDLSELLFCIFVMAGITQAARRGAHVATQLLLHTLQGRARLALILFIHSATACVFLLLAWYAVRNAVLAHDQTTPVLQIPWSVGYGCLATGLAMIAVCSITAIIRHTWGGEAVIVNLADAGPGVV